MVDEKCARLRANAVEKSQNRHLPCLQFPKVPLNPCNRRIWMVKTDAVDAVESIKIILVWCIVPVPCDDIEWRMVKLRGPQPPLKFRHNMEIAIAILVRAATGV